MNSKTTTEEREPGIPFEEKIDILFHEIDLAMKWSRPSILFAVYSSGSILAKAKAELEDRLSNHRQKTQIVEISGKKQSNFSTDIFQLPHLSRSILFIDDINCKCGEENSGFFKELKWNLEKFIDHQVKVIFWLAEEDVSLFATNAIECWILRHRVVEFQDSPYQTNALLQTLESTWQDMGENILDDPASSAAIQEILQAPEKVEANFFHGNLILMLGVLYWRKGNAVDAERFMNSALGIARSIGHQKLENQCTNAIALVSSVKQASSNVAKPDEPERKPSLEAGDNLPAAEKSGAAPEIDQLEENIISVPITEERGTAMKESDQVFDQKTSAEWNELGNKFLRAGSYNDAITAFTKAIEMAPEISWPYIRNLASAHYHKGKIKGKSSAGRMEEPDVWEGEDDDAEPIPFFDQEDIPEAKRGDAVEEEAVNETGRSGGFEGASTSIPPSTNSNEVAQKVKGDFKTYLSPSTESRPVTPSRIQTAECELTGSRKSIPDALPTVNTQNNPEPGQGPKSPYEWNQMGNSFVNARDFDRAISAYKKSIELDPHFGQPYSNLASVLYQTGKYQSAILLLQKSLDYLVSPQEKALSWNRLGDVYRRMRDYGNALAAYQEANRLNPDTNPVLTRARLSLMNSVAVG